MAALNANAYYRESQVSTASRGQLLLMVYDGALRFLEEARRAITTRDYEAQNTNLTKAQNLVMELMITLDHKVNPQLAANLDRLYRYMYDRLVYANINDDALAVTEVAGLLADLRTTWAEADALARRQESSTLVGGHVA